MYVAKRRWPKLCPKIDFPLSNEYPIVYQQSRTPQKQSNNSDGFLNDKPWGTPKVQVWGSYLVLEAQLYSASILQVLHISSVLSGVPYSV